MKSAGASAREKRLIDIYTAGAIALLFLVSTANAAWVAAFALALLAAGLFVFPAQRSRVVIVGTIGAITGLAVAVLVRIFG